MRWFVELSALQRQVLVVVDQSTDAERRDVWHRSVLGQLDGFQRDVLEDAVLDDGHHARRW